ncbi:MAG: hypothetical protein PWQ32_1079 [Thermococcaceae archaeon]|uniref:DNA double-strand break repair nuclease NurA n=1 Tax=Pyrococcus sp. TaxID=33866 RepID=UPI00258551BB|nr:DNA double-strand break repair nuclease NurA [Pyrococcus sp.]MDK2783490.1 hypothetical protein [Thermococcaceae archaeon]MDK2870353.1 hypothetical protein [Pyrococcus sp.]MDK2983705.1 hypothetical protein [Thermococcaceae archaeon]
MPRFYDLFGDILSQKKDHWRTRYHKLPGSINSILFQELKNWWVTAPLKSYERKPSYFNVLAIDSSYQMERLKNGGLFYVVRALGIDKNKEYRLLGADFDYVDGPTHEVTNIFSRKMEYLEIKLANEAISGGFSGVVLIDGSLYGRISHLVIESPLSHERDFFLKYYKEVLRLFKLANRNNVMVIGISKESNSRFFRDFLVKQIVKLPSVRGKVPEDKAKHLISLVLDNRRRALEELDMLKHEYGDIGLLNETVKELMVPRPDYQLLEISNLDPGYTIPLLLGPSKRWLRGLSQIESDPEGYIRTAFPTLSMDKDFRGAAIKVLKQLRELPSIVSFHALLDKRDSPLRIDVPAFCLGLSKKFHDVGWPEPINKNILDDVLSIVVTGYGGLEYHNIWLWKVDKEVKFHRKEFDDMYLSKFKEVVEVDINARDYRRVKLF